MKYFKQTIYHSLAFLTAHHDDLSNLQQNILDFLKLYFKHDLQF